jgi:hypothetical protein
MDVEFKPVIDTPEMTEHQLLEDRRRREEKARAQAHWALLRDSIKNVCRAVEQSDSEDLWLSHGIHHQRKLNHTYPVQTALFMPQRKVRTNTCSCFVLELVGCVRPLLITIDHANTDFLSL